MVPERFGKYRVLRRIATGGMSEVYLCRLAGEAGFRKRVALKAVHPRHAGDPRFRELFIREARIAASLSHPNLVQVFDFGRDGDTYFLAMEYVEGWDLAHAAARARQTGLAVPPGVWRHWVEGIWAGLGHLHDRGIVHRDVSPGNVLLGRTGAVKLTDFGVSQAVGLSGEESDLPAGKIGYLSPERAGGAAATVASDLFAAAVISAELLLGRRLFEGEDPAELLERVRAFDGLGLEFPGTAEDVAGAVRTGLAADPSGRFRRAGDFLETLAACAPARASAGELADFWDALFPACEEEDTSPFQPAAADGAVSMVKEPRPRYGVGRRTMTAGAAAIVVLAAGGAMLWHGGKKAEGPGAPASVAQPPSVPQPMQPPAPISESAAPAKVKRPGVSEPAGRHSVRIETEPEGARIVLENGGSVGTTPAQLDTASLGGAGIVLERDGYERKSVPASVLAKLSTVRMELEPMFGTVEAIQAVPWARVYADDRLLGETPLTNIRLPVGEHRLRFVNEPLGVERIVTVVVRVGANPKIIVPLAAEGHR